MTMTMPFHTAEAARAGLRVDSDDLLLSAINDIHPVWLRERCLESFHVEPSTRQPKNNMHEEDGILDLKVLGVQKVDPSSEFPKGGYHINFSDGKKCFYRKDLLDAEFANERTFLQITDWDFPEEFLWDNQALHAPSVYDYNDVVSMDNDMARKFLSVVLSTGLALVENVPRVDGECARFGAQVSTVRDTEWGLNFNVRSSPDNENGGKMDLAYTPLPIGMHIDNAYRIDAPPSYQMLHAIEHCSGGPPECYVHNQFVDGFKVANDLCHENREFFDILTKVTLRWENNGGDDSSLLYRYAPMIEVEDEVRKSDACPRVMAINFSAKSGGYAPFLPHEELQKFYNAKHTMSTMLHDPKYTVQFQLYPGALVIFDNRRVLHSRSAVAPTDGHRWLQGCYLNRDGLAFRYERLRRQLANLTETPFHSLKSATFEDWNRMGIEYDENIGKETIPNLLRMLESQKDAYLGAPVSLYEHNLQTATRALRGGETEETIVMSLFHDVFETLAIKNHGELAGAMLAPWISPQSAWMLAHHEIFQGFYYFGHFGQDPNARDMFVNHPFYNSTVKWCEMYDQASFDPNYPTLPLSTFLPYVERVFSREQYWWNPSHPKAGAIDGSSSFGEESTDSSVPHPSKIVHIPYCEDTWTCYSDDHDALGTVKL